MGWYISRSQSSIGSFTGLELVLEEREEVQRETRN
jgi:hypothetical protein